MREAYEDEARKHGHEPGLCMLAPPDSVTTAFVADDVDRAWDELGPYLMHDVRMYGEWNVDKENIASLSQSRSVDELREERGAHRIYSVDEAVDIVKDGGFLSLHAAVRGPSARARVEVPEDRHRRRDPGGQVAPPTNEPASTNGV